MYATLLEIVSLTDQNSLFQNLSIEPDHVIMFCTTNLYEKPIKVPLSGTTMRRPRAAKCEIVEIDDFLKKSLPPKCQLRAMSADGIVGKIK